MPFIILAHDKPNSERLRAKLRSEHLAYLSARKGQMLAGGALLDQDGKSIGGMIIVDTEDRAAAERFVGEDPFTTGGVFGAIQILTWRKTFFDRQRIPIEGRPSS
ncbi:YciI family protein [Variovorax sp. J22R115]|uniref:YciI family protein n=1 Tax=Variovorax sp. J22R115 TaxID=3053509 RepID=UPI00257620BA|nr:YciI family protein [Variovorax sp. J22R115]MDM0050340.1 YciI family protein [Variovorax sp. J22R115]